MLRERSDFYIGAPLGPDPAETADLRIAGIFPVKSA
jgi:hypothetical protein